MARKDLNLKIGGHAITTKADFTETTLLSCGFKVPAVPQYNNAEYRQRAQDLGYGSDLALMSQDHELGHAFIALITGFVESPTFRGLATHATTGKYYEHWAEEEALVLSLQKFVRLNGLDLLEDVILPTLLAQGLEP